VNRRRFVLAATGTLAFALARAQRSDPRATASAAPVVPTVAAEFPAVTPRILTFPRDHGSHPAYRTEWWYITGWTRDDAGIERGVQVTFFRSRPGVAESAHSAFAPVQVLFAHAAIADPALRRLRHDQRAAREGFGLAVADTTRTAVTLDDWSLVQDGDDYRARIPARDFTLALDFRTAGPPLLQGEAGMSRKGPLAAQASYYYSRPQLQVSGRLAIEGRDHPVSGVAWLDHEWSSEYLAPKARGWDWTGIDLDDGGALMAFRIRDADGQPLWAGGTLRSAAGDVRRFGPADVRFLPVRRWRSPRTGIEYPVATRVVAGDRAVLLSPMFDDQELDARATVGTVYWEGAVRASVDGRDAGRGYLELTGYGEPLRL
jgi:predicted secreted hydrolase